MKLTIDLSRDTDTTEETWVSHCLEIDAVSQGSSPGHAITMIAEAVDMMVRDEMEAQGRAGNVAPGWEQAFATIAEEVAKRDTVANLLAAAHDAGAATHPAWPEFQRTMEGKPCDRGAFESAWEQFRGEWNETTAAEAEERYENDRSQD